MDFSAGFALFTAIVTGAIGPCLAFRIGNLVVDTFLRLAFGGKFEIK